MSTTEKRIYVGNVFQNTDDCLKQLYDRFSKFGQCKDGEFENHGTFAYVDMEFENEAQYQNLKRCFNNVKYKGNELRVGEAKPNWETVQALRKLQDTKENHAKEEEMKKKNWKHYKKLENIRMSWEDRNNVIPGRIRAAPRPKSQLRNATFRINVNGSLKVYKCYKTKLWGYEREKDVKDLVSKFSNNQWRNDYDHIVDRLTYQRSKLPIKYVSEIEHEQDDHDNKINEEQKINNVLGNLLENFDFDKPLNLEDDDGGDESRFRDNKSVTAQIPKDQHAAPLNSRTSDPEDELEEVGEIINEEASEEQEFIPTFAGTAIQNEEDTGKTETLRDIFNPEQTNDEAFKLIPESDDDIDHIRDLEIEEMTSVPQEASETTVIETQIARNDKAELFFPHFASPFLVGQTQLSKIRSTYNEEELESWGEQFWESRGAWMKDAKRRKKDAMRQLKKKWAKNGNGLLL